MTNTQPKPMFKKQIDKLNVPKSLPVFYENRENCCGCSACFAICPAHAISMEPDDEGFLYPTIDAKKCVKCYKCLDICVFKLDQRKKGYYTGQKGGTI